MCLGIETMAIMSLAAGAIGTGVSVMGAMQQGKAAQAQAKYQAAVSENNAATARMQAADALERGKIEEQQHRTKVTRLLGEQRANIAASGFELGDMTSQDIFGDTAALGELDALNIRNNAKREAWGYEVQAGNFNADASLSRMSGRNSRTASMWQAGGDLLSGASKFANNYVDFNKKGAFG